MDKMMNKRGIMYSRLNDASEEVELWTYKMKSRAAERRQDNRNISRLTKMDDEY